LDHGVDPLFNVDSCRRRRRHSKVSYSKKYGVDLARFVNKTNCVVYASTKVDRKTPQFP